LLKRIRPKATARGKQEREQCCRNDPANPPAAYLHTYLPAGCGSCQEDRPKFAQRMMNLPRKELFFARTYILSGFGRVKMSRSFDLDVRIRGASLGYSVLCLRACAWAETGTPSRAGFGCGFPP